MRHSTTVGVDLAKNVIQVSVVSPRGKELLNRSFTRAKFAEFLSKQKLSLVAFESCASAHYWAHAAKRHGHEARIIPAKAVVPFRQGHKTDSNDALAVAEAARRPNIKEAPMKTAEQRGLQAIQRSKEVDGLVKLHPVCSRLTAIKGIGPVGALSLYAVMGSGKAFTRSCEFSSYLGLTPRQYSSGGETNIVDISKTVGNRRLRSILIQGVRAYVYRMKEPRSLKDRWLKDLIERAGPNRAAVALANKNVRTAWAMVTQGTEYQGRLQLEMAA
jgi:transposase